MAKNSKNAKPVAAAATKAKAKAKAIAKVEAKVNSNDPFIRDSFALSAAIKDHISKGADWEKQTQRLLISAALLAVQPGADGNPTGQITPLIELVEGTRTLTHDQNVEKWVLMYAPVIVKDKKPRFSMVKAKKFLESGIENYEKMLLTSKFYKKLTPPPVPFKGFDDMAKLIALVKQIEKYSEAKRTGVLEVQGEEIELSHDQREKIEIDEDLHAELSALVKRGARPKAKVIDGEAVAIN